MAEISIRRAGIADVKVVAALAAKVYDADPGELEPEFQRSLCSTNHAVFLAEAEGEAVAFAETAVRRDWVNGCEFSPTGFLEGIFVDEKYRRCGVARRLVEEAKNWAVERGCRELASDRLLENELSEKFHLGCGFEETERTVSYRQIIAAQGLQPKFWEALDRLIGESEIVIDRPKGSAHPRYPSLIYPLDYGYLKGTSSMDGDGIDVWLGSLQRKALDAIIVTVDLFKRDSEIKLLLGCTAEEKQTILDMLNDRMMSAILIERA